jgi:hypothetical protein
VTVWNVVTPIIGIEFVWTLLAVIGAVAAAWAVMDGWKDLRALEPSERNGRRSIARAVIRNNAIRLFIQVIWICIGIPLVMDGNPVPLTFITGALVLTNASLATLSVLETRGRIRLRHQIEDKYYQRRSGDPE